MRTAIITGASGSIGGAAAEKLAAEGIACVLCSNSHPEKAEELRNRIVSAGGEAVCMCADLSSFSEADRLVKETVKMYGRLDYLVAAAGISRRGMFIDSDEYLWNEVISTNLTGFASVAKASIYEMLRLGEGSIVAVSSIWGKEGASMESIYSASKAGMAGLAKSLAKEYGYSGIRINCVSPGAIETPMNAFLSEDEKSELVADIPAGRFGDPREVAEIIYSIMTNRYITGQDLTIDGGFTL